MSINIIDNKVCIDGTLIPLYTDAFNGTVRIHDPFKKLWNIILTSKFVRPIPLSITGANDINVTDSVVYGCGIPNEFVQWCPSDGIATANDTVISFTDINTKLLINWSTDVDTTIRFYTVYNDLPYRAYPIVDTTGAFTVYSGTSGSFEIYNCRFMVAVVDNATNVTLNVSKGCDTRECSFIKPNLSFCFRSNYYELPVTETIVVNDKEVVQLNPELGTLYERIITTLTLLAKDFPCDNVIPKLFTSPYLGVWQPLAGVGPIRYFLPAIITEFDLPTESFTNLTGQSFLTDPTSPVMIFTFIRENLNGPILNDGFLLNTFNNLLDHRINWEIVNPNMDHILIGFYSSSNFAFNEQNNLFLITGDKGPSIFDANKCNEFRGSFICQNVVRIYVATNADIQIKLNIQIIVPEIKVSPVITLEKSSIDYYRPNTCPPSNQLIPITETKLLTEDPLAITNGSIDPFECFVDAATYVSEYLDKTALSILLFDNPISTRDVLEPIIFEKREIRTLELGSLRYAGLDANLSDDTAPGKFVTFFWVRNHIGFGIPRYLLNRGDLVHVNVNLIVRLNIAPFRFDRTIEIIFGLHGYVYFGDLKDWPYLNAIQPSGTTKQVLDTIKIPANSPGRLYNRVFDVQYVLGQNEPGFGLNLQIPFNINVAITQAEFNQVTMSFGPLS